MKDENKTKKQLINELTELRRRNVELEQHSKDTDKQFEESEKAFTDVEKELKGVGMELVIGLSEVFEALKKVASGDPDVRISEESEVELISQLKHIVNLTAMNIGEMVDQCHEFAISLCEHFDVVEEGLKRRP